MDMEVGITVEVSQAVEAVDLMISKEAMRWQTFRLQR
jgi:hypothetical protein